MCQLSSVLAISDVLGFLSYASLEPLIGQFQESVHLFKASDFLRVEFGLCQLLFSVNQHLPVAM